MAIYSCVTSSYIQETLAGGVHNITDNYMLALYDSTAILDRDTIAYTPIGECIGTNYTPGGSLLDGANIIRDNNTIIISFNNLKFPDITLLDVRGCMIYNASSGSKSVAVFDFGNKLVYPDTTLTLIMPPANALLGLIRYNN